MMTCWHGFWCMLVQYFEDAPNSQADHFVSRCFTGFDDSHVIFQAFWCQSPRVEVLSAVTGESIAVFEKEEFADSSVKAFKQRLATADWRYTIPTNGCYKNNSPLDDDQTLALGVVQLVKVEFLPADMERDRQIMVACSQDNDKLLEQQLDKPGSPNFEDADGKTPLFLTASHGSLQCVHLLLEAGANKDTRPGNWLSNASIHSSSEWASWSCPISGGVWCQQRPRPEEIQEQRLFTLQLRRGTLEVVRFLVESGANKDQDKTNGATPLFVADLRKGILKLSDFWLSLVPTKTKVRLLEQRLYT